MLNKSSILQSNANKSGLICILLSVVFFFKTGLKYLFFILLSIGGIYQFKKYQLKYQSENLISIIFIPAIVFILSYVFYYSIIIYRKKNNIYIFYENYFQNLITEKVFENKNIQNIYRFRNYIFIVIDNELLVLNFKSMDENHKALNYLGFFKN